MKLIWRHSFEQFSLVFGLSLLVVGGCAAPGAVKTEAAHTLNGSCLELFSSGSLGGYQHVAHQIAGKAVFALGVDAKTGRQWCGIGRSNTDVGSQAFGPAGSSVTWEQVEAIAIARCNSVSGGAVSCKVFARNNDILWGKEKDVEFK